MAFGIKVGSTFLDIDAGSQLTFEINTELWVTGEPTINVGSYSFPIDLPLTDTNRYLLRFPDRIEAATTLEVIENVTIYIGQGKSIGLPVMNGRLFVKNATNKKCSVFLVVEGLSRQKEKKVKDVDLGVFDIGGPVTLQSLMNGTIAYPLDNDFVFFPVWNESFRDVYSELDGTMDDNFEVGLNTSLRINHHVKLGATADWAFMKIADAKKKNNLMIVPFLRLEIVLERIALSIGYTLINEWIGDNEELRAICVFNNKSINDLETSYKNKIRYNEHLPIEMLVTDILKEVAKFAFCGLFVNHYSKTITMRPYRQVLSDGPRQNWTDRTTTDYEIEQDNEVPKSIGYAIDGSDAYFNNSYVSSVSLLADGAVIADYWHRGGRAYNHSLIDGYYHVKRDNSVMRYDPSRTTTYAETWWRFNHQFKQVQIGGRGDSYLSKVIPMWSDSGPNSFGSLQDWSIPRVDIPMDMKLKIEDEVIEHHATFSNIRLAIYRGMRKYALSSDGSETAYEYPYANATAYDPATEDETFNHSLHLDGDKGMYAQYGRDWMSFMQLKKTVNRYLNLSIQDILNHREYDKVRIQNMDYFIKSIKVSVNSQGMGLSECTLVTVPFSTKIG